MLIYSLGYTLLFTTLWSTATGYLALSHKIYGMPSGEIVPLRTNHLAPCWVLDPNRLELPGLTSNIILGPDFPLLKSSDQVPTHNVGQMETKIGFNISSYEGSILLNETVSLQPTYNGWKMNEGQAIWDRFDTAQFGNTNAYNQRIFQSLRICK
jgi:hypothetical protein